MSISPQTTTAPSPTGTALTEVQVAEQLGLSVATLRAWRHRGKGPRFVRFGRAVRYLPADIEAFIRSSAVDTVAVSSPDQASETAELPYESLETRPAVLG